MLKMCDKCGFFYDDAQGACPRCSAPSNSGNGTNNAQTSSGNATQNSDYGFGPISSNQEEDNGIFSSEIFLKAKDLFDKHRKASIISLSVIAGVIVLSVIISAIAKNAPINIDLEDYVSEAIILDEDLEDSYGSYYYLDTYENYDAGAGLHLSGYNSYAYVDNVRNIIDWDSLIADVNEKLEKKNNSRRYITFWDCFDSSSFEFEVDPSENLSNGDIVTVDVTVQMSTYYEDYYEDVEFKMCDEKYSFEFEVQGLETVDAFNPFDYVSFVASGANGYGSVRPVVDPELNKEISVSGYSVQYNRENSYYLYHGEDYVTTVTFSCDEDYSSNGSYKNGDSVKMICYCSDEDTLWDYGIQVAQTEKTYKVENLGDYITGSTKLSAEEVQKFVNHANGEISNRYSNNDSYKDFTHNSTYIATYTDPDSGYFKNELCLVYSYSQRKVFSEEYETMYCYFTYRDLICNSSGAVQLEPAEYFEQHYYRYDTVENLLNGKYSPDSFSTTKI